MGRFATWPACAAHGLAVMLVVTASAHFVPAGVTVMPNHADLVAMLPSFVPLPDVVIYGTGVLELLGAAGLVVAATRWAAADPAQEVHCHVRPRYRDDRRHPRLLRRRLVRLGATAATGRVEGRPHVGSLLGMAVAVTGGILAWQSWDSGSVLADDRALRAYLIIVGIEFTVAAGGAVALLVARKTEYQAPWICLVVAVHFYPMAPVLHDARLYLLATVLTIAALTAIPLARRRHLAISATTGAAAGTALLAVATWSMATLIF